MCADRASAIDALARTDTPLPIQPAQKSMCIGEAKTEPKLALSMRLCCKHTSMSGCDMQARQQHDRLYLPEKYPVSQLQTCECRFVSAGMQDIDKQTSQALLEFSYHLAIGDTNEAYKVTALALLKPHDALTTVLLYLQLSLRSFIITKNTPHSCAGGSCAI